MVCYGRYSVPMFLSFGWIAVVMLKPMYYDAPAGSDLVFWLFIGGVSYTCGSWYLVNDTDPFNHVIWHCFVLFGTFCHYFGIYHYVVPFDDVNVDVTSLSITNLIDNTLGLGFPLVDSIGQWTGYR
eukprot:UN11556